MQPQRPRPPATFPRQPIPNLYIRASPGPRSPGPESLQLGNSLGRRACPQGALVVRDPLTLRNDSPARVADAGDGSVAARNGDGGVITGRQRRPQQAPCKKRRQWGECRRGDSNNEKAEVSSPLMRRVCAPFDTRFPANQNDVTAGTSAWPVVGEQGRRADRGS